MIHSNHYRVDYLLHGKYRSFYVCAAIMDNAAAWHWAAVDAGFGQIPKYRMDRVPLVSKPKAEQFGLTDVQWATA